MNCNTVVVIEIKKHIRHFFSLLMLLLFVSCSRETTEELPGQRIIARVGDRTITADEFRYSYEFGLGQIKKGDNPRRAYLDYLIKELLLANEGYRLGLNKNPYVTNRLERRRNNNLLQAFYIRHVHRKVKIPEEQIQESVKKSTVKYRMTVWPVPSLEEAEKVRTAAGKSSLEDYIEDQLARQEIKLTNKKFYETDWLDYLDIPPQIFEKIKDLPLGETSDPFPLGNGYAVAQVLDINLHGITTSQLLSGPKRKNMEERLYSIQADSIAHAVMDSILTPLDVRLKGGVLEELARPLYQWFQDGLPDQISVFSKVENPADTAKQYIKEIYQLLDKTLVTYKNSDKSVADYLDYMDYYRKNLRQSSSFENFTNRLIAEIGKMVKDETFINIAIEEGHHDSLNSVHDLKIWEQKWTYDVYRHEVVNELDVTEPEMKDFFKNRYRELGIANVDTQRFYKYESDVYKAVLYEKHMDRLNNKLEELKEKYPVFVDDELLGQLDLVESKKSNNITMFVRKNFSGEEVVPGVDLKWFNLNTN